MYALHGDPLTGNARSTSELPTTQPDLNHPETLLNALIHLREEVDAEGRRQLAAWQPSIRRRSFLISGLNMACYLALRRRDLRPVQAALAPLGLSSLGRIETHVMPNLDAVIAALDHLCRAEGGTAPPSAVPPRPSLRRFMRGKRMLRRETNAVFGPATNGRRVRIMVTLPTEAAENYDLVRDLLRSGMNCARINCAHDDPVLWKAMLANIRRAASELDTPCPVAMDLAGPKSRTAEVIRPAGGLLYRGDRVLLTRGTPEKPKDYAAAVRCTLEAALDQAKIGAAVWFDDGKIGAVVDDVLPHGLSLRITHARAKGEKLKDDKGVNFPDTDLLLNPLTDKDLLDLDFAVAYADIVNYSFVQTAADVQRLQTEIADRQRRQPEPRPLAVVAKIETARAVSNLPELIVQAAGLHPFGVMIARGDLAVEIGYERMAEMQEEILWLCEAAHVPVIWATQVLESAAKEGRPSRAEITDAAMAERAECVMLNKGPYIVQAVTILDDVLTRMQAHQSKKSPQLRALKSW